MESPFSIRAEQFLSVYVTMLALVNAGLGLALVPKSAACLGFGQVRYLPLDPDPEIRSDLFLVWRDANDNPAFGAVIAAMRSERR